MQDGLRGIVQGEGLYFPVMMLFLRASLKLDLS